MGIATEALREYIVVAIDVVRRRWLLLFLPVLIAAVAGIAAVKLTPKMYTTTSMLLIQGANRTPTGGGPVQQLNALEQVRALEAWLKSDQVLAELLEQMPGYRPALSPERLLIQTRILAASLSLELVGNSVLQISLQGRSPAGLGRQLEVVIARLMEGLTGPEQNVLSAPQFMLMRRSEDVALAENTLMRAIEAGGSQSPQQVRTMLHQLWKSSHGGSTESDQGEAATTRLRSAISGDRLYVQQLEALYAAYQTALAREESLRRQGGSNRSNYVGIFDSPDNLLVVGRPRDPIFGESIAKKPAIGGILLSVLLAGGLVVVVELLEGRLRTRKEFEAVAGIPVIARLGRTPAGQPS